MPLDSHTLNELIEAIREHKEVFASPEDANYFRANLKKKEPVPPKVEEKKKEAPPPPKIEAPPKKETPLPPPKIEEERPEESLKVRIDLSGVKHLLSTVAPELAILDEIPSDAVARRISERWKTKNQTAPISILSYQEPKEQKELLEGVAKALDVYFGPARLVNAEMIEKEKQWEMFLGVENLKMIVVCDYTLWQLRGLMHHYKETPAQGVRMVGNIPIFLLPDLSLYLKDPLLKRSLWKALCQKFS